MTPRRWQNTYRAPVREITADRLPRSFARWAAIFMPLIRCCLLPPRSLLPPLTPARATGEARSILSCLMPRLPNPLAAGLPPRSIALIVDRLDWHARELIKAFAALGINAVAVRLESC